MENRIEPQWREGSWAEFYPPPPLFHMLKSKVFGERIFKDVINVQ